MGGCSSLVGNHHVKDYTGDVGVDERIILKRARYFYSCGCVLGRVHVDGDEHWVFVTTSL